LWEIKVIFTLNTRLCLLKYLNKGNKDDNKNYLTYYTHCLVIITLTNNIKANKNISYVFINFIVFLFFLKKTAHAYFKRPYFFLSFLAGKLNTVKPTLTRRELSRKILTKPASRLAKLYIQILL